MSHETSLLTLGAADLLRGPTPQTFSVDSAAGNVSLPLPRSLSAPIEGVPFMAYLTLEAARLDGIPDADVIAWMGLDEARFGGVAPGSGARFARASDLWTERLDEALAAVPAPGERPFDEVYEELLGQTLLWWARSVAPLDRDVGSFVTYQRHALAAVDPEAFSRDLGLTNGDDLRLARHWRRRMTDPEVSERARAAMEGPLPPMPALTLSPLVFPPRKEPA